MYTIYFEALSTQLAMSTLPEATDVHLNTMYRFFY